MKKVVVFILFTICLCLVPQQITYAKNVDSWAALKSAIEKQKKDSYCEYNLTKNFTADSTITIKNKKVSIKGSDKTISRSGTFMGNMFTVEGKNATLHFVGESSKKKLTIKGLAKKTISGHIVVLKDSGSFYDEEYSVIQDNHVTGNGGAIYIYKGCKAVLYSDSSIIGCSADETGNAIYNDGTLEIAGCNISGTLNNRADIQNAINGVISFKTKNGNNGSTVKVKIEKGIYVTRQDAIKICNDFNLSDAKFKIKIDASKIPNNGRIINVTANINNNGGANSVLGCFSPLAGFNNCQLLVYQNNIVKGINLTSASFVNAATKKAPQYTILQIGETVNLNGTYGIKGAITKSAVWKSSDTNAAIITNAKWTTCSVYGRSVSSKPFKVSYEVTNPNNKTVRAEAFFITEEKPTITMSAVKNGSSTKMTAPTYKNKYVQQKYIWQQSTDGKKWVNVTEGTGYNSNVYTTPAVTLAYKKNQYRCVIKLRVYAGSDEKTLCSNVLSMADIDKLDAKVSLADQEASYTGSPIGIKMAKVTPRELTKYVSYTYYTDVACVNKTTAANGAKKTGGAPANAGTYYVVAKLASSEKYKAATSQFAILKINKSAGEIKVSKEKINLIAGVKTNIVMTKNKGNADYTVKSSNPKVLTVSKQGNTIIATPLKAGSVKVTINSIENNNVTACTKTINVTVCPAAVVLKSVKNRSEGKIELRWKKDKTASGYEIQCAYDENFKKIAKKTSINRKKAKKGIARIKKLKKNKTYYFRVRAYYKKGKKKIVGVWSNVKSVKKK